MRSNVDVTAIHSSVSNTLAHEQDTLGEDDIYSIVSDTSLGGTATVTMHTDTQQDHTYDATEFHSQIHNSELPEYTTLQHGNAANTQIDSNSLLGAYDKSILTLARILRSAQK